MAGPDLTPDTSANPFVEVFIDPVDLHEDTATLTLLRLSDGREWKVRGGVRVAPGVAALDFECPFGVEATYRAEMFDELGLSLGFTESTTVTLAYAGTVVHQPLAPQLWAPVRVLNGSAAALNRPRDGEGVDIEGGTVGKWIGSTRRGVRGVAVSLLTETLDAADQVQAMLGTYTTPQVGVLCIRSSTAIRWPRTFFASGDLAEVERDVRVGGTLIQFDGSMDEVEPPFPGLVVPLLTYDDLDAFGTYAEQDANWATYTARDRAYELAGLANA